MKNLRLPLIICLAVLSTTFFSCKKEVSPRLKVTVVNEDNFPLEGAVVNVEARQTDQSRLSDEFAQEERTDNQGNAFFQFKNTVLITIIATRGTLIDSTFALLETKRKRKNEDNLTEKKITLD